MNIPKIEPNIIKYVMITVLLLCICSAIFNNTIYSEHYTQQNHYNYNNSTKLISDKCIIENDDKPSILQFDLTYKQNSVDAYDDANNKMSNNMKINDKHEDSYNYDYDMIDDIIYDNKHHKIEQQHNHNIITSPHTHIGKYRCHLNWSLPIDHYNKSTQI